MHGADLLAADAAPLVTSSAAMLTAVVGAVVAGVSMRRSARADDAKTAAENAEQKADAQGVGLTYLRAALETQSQQLADARAEIRDQRNNLVAAEARIDQLEVEVKACHMERDQLAIEVAELRGRA